MLSTLIYWIVVWIVSVLLCVFMAQRKGYPHGTGLMLGVLLGPVGALFVVLVMPYSEDAEDRPDPSAKRIDAIAEAYKRGEKV